MKRYRLRRCILWMCAAGALALSALLLYRAGKRIVMIRGHGTGSAESCAFTESGRRLDNPNRGFYYMHGFQIDDWAADLDAVGRIGRDRDTRLALIEFNLQYYRDRPISEQGLWKLETLFGELDRVGKQLIVRFVYDWDGENELHEPEDIGVILEHMRQVGPTLRKHKDRIFVLQGLFIGNWGEMNGTKYADGESLRALAEQLAQATDPATFLSVRMPMQWRMVTGIGDASEVARGDGTLASRLGLFNDGMLGSWSDYGTYGNQTKEEDGDFTYWNREQELAFQEVLCRIVPIGGEVIVDNPYNDFENALEDMRRMHVTYLNREYDRNVLDKWADATVEEEGCFQGMSGLSYIERHLGYRLLIHSARLEYGFWEDRVDVEVDLRNVGFAPLYHEAQVRVALKAEEGDEVRVYGVSHDLRELAGGNEAQRLSTVRREISLAGQAAGRYGVYLDIRDASSGERILLANDQDPEEYGYRIGTVELESTETFGEGLKQWLKEQWESRKSTS